MFVKKKNKWICYDRQGHTAEGLTKDHARSLWHVYYDNKNTGIPNMFEVYDMKSFNRLN